MSLITALARLEAVGTGRAQPAATVRHRRLSDHPLVFVPLTTAGETGAPLGALVGTDRDAPRLLVVPQPRDRDLRFTFLADLADVVLPQHRLPVSWRLPASAAPLVSDAFYPYTPFRSGTSHGDRRLAFAVPSDGSGPDRVIDEAAESGWGLLELPARHTPRTDPEAVRAVAAVVRRLLDRGGAATSERAPHPTPLTADRVAVGTAHRDQAAAIRAALADLGVPDVTVDTANRLQGREYDVTVVLHPLSGRPDATAFHLETGRLCVLASRHRHACIMICRAGVTDLLDDYPSTEPVQLGTLVKFPDGWEANHAVLSHLREHRVTWHP
ncbi:hypothetical protein SCANM63S_05163 [Streptomyces canarius]